MKGQEPKKPKDRKIHRHPRGTWNEIRIKYESGVQVNQLAEEYGIYNTTISRKATQQKWQRNATIAEEALNDAKSKFQAKLSETYQDLIEKANDRHLKMSGYGQQFGAALSKELQLNLKALQQKRAAMGSTDANPKYLEGFGRIAYQLSVTWATIERAARFEREVLKLSDKDPWESDEKDQDTMGRLTEIFEEGQRRLAEDCDSAEAQEEEKEAVHSSDPAE